MSQSEAQYTDVVSSENRDIQFINQEQATTFNNNQDNFFDPGQ